jgi:hypothetical protein
MTDREVAEMLGFRLVLRPGSDSQPPLVRVLQARLAVGPDLWVWVDVPVIPPDEEDAPDEED